MAETRETRTAAEILRVAEKRLIVIREALRTRRADFYLLKLEHDHAALVGRSHRL